MNKSKEAPASFFMLGEVAWMNSLSNQFYGAWQVRPYPGYGNPYIVPITEAESYIVLKMPENVQQKTATRHAELVSAPAQQTDLLEEMINVNPVKAHQLTLF